MTFYQIIGSILFASHEQLDERIINDTTSDEQQGSRNQLATVRTQTFGQETSDNAMGNFNFENQYTSNNKINKIK